MSVKLADTLSPMSDFPVAMGEDINLVKEDGSEKSLQSMYEDGELGGESLPTPVAEDMILISKDVTRTTNLEWAQVHKSEIGDIPFKGTHDEWDDLSDEEKAQYETVIFTDDYGANDVEKYSTEEVKTNKVWINGKPIYRKVIVGNSRGDVVFATNIDTLVNTYGHFSMPSFSGVSIPFGSPSYYFTAVVNNSSEAVLYTNHTSYTGYKIVIEYTKTN